MTFKKLFITTGFFILASCSIYESGGRKAIETNEGNLVGSYSFAQTLTEYYICEQQTVEPDFLKSPLEVIDTPFDSKNLTTLYNSHSNPPSVIVYTVSAKDTYTFCRISSLMPSSQNLSLQKIQQIARLASVQIDKLLNSTRP